MVKFGEVTGFNTSVVYANHGRIAFGNIYVKYLLVSVLFCDSTIAKAQHITFLSEVV